MIAVAPHPVRVEGRLDPQLSRWLWLVKWLLAIPHFIVLLFLSIAFARADGRCLLRDPVHWEVPALDFRLQPRRSTLGVARGLLHVRSAGNRPLSPVYARAAADYPAVLDVQYRDQLSRGLVLVKWWLLAIPHYLLLGVILGGGGMAVHAGWERSTGSGAARRADRSTRALRRGRAALHHRLSARNLRFRRRAEPLGSASSRTPAS